MAAARSRPLVFARSERSWPMAVRALCRDGLHGGDARPHASFRRHRRTALFRPHARAARLDGRADRSGAVGAVRHLRRRESGRLVAASLGEIRRHQQSGLLPHQVRRLGPRRPYPAASHHRYRAPARERLMPHAGLVLLVLARLPVPEALYRSSVAMLPRGPAAQLATAMGLGALLGPMNGSVGASVLGLSRVGAPRLPAPGVAAP